MSTFIPQSIPYQCQCRGVGGQKSQNLVNVLCEQPLSYISAQLYCIILGRVNKGSFYSERTEFTKGTEIGLEIEDVLKFDSSEAKRPQIDLPKCDNNDYIHGILFLNCFDLP